MRTPPPPVKGPNVDQIKQVSMTLMSYLSPYTLPTPRYPLPSNPFSFLFPRRHGPQSPEASFVTIAHVRQHDFRDWRSRETWSRNRSGIFEKILEFRGKPKIRNDYDRIQNNVEGQKAIKLSFRHSILFKLFLVLDDHEQCHLRCIALLLNPSLYFRSMIVYGRKGCLSPHYSLGKTFYLTLTG